MNRGALWAVIGVSLILLLGLTGAIGNRDEREPVSATDYADNICGAVGAWRGSIEAIVDDLRTPQALGSAGSEEPQSETPQGRTGYIRAGVERAVQATDTLAEAVERAGVPQTPEGDAVAEDFRDWAGGARTALDKASVALDEEPDSLEQALGATAAAVRAIGATLTSGTRTVAQAVRTDPELVPAFRDSDNCKELRTDRGAP